MQRPRELSLGRDNGEELIPESQKFEAIVIEGYIITRTSELTSQGTWEEAPYSILPCSLSTSLVEPIRSCKARKPKWFSSEKKKKRNCTYVEWQILARLTVVIILQYIQMSKCFTIFLKLLSLLYVSDTSS